MPTSTLVVLTPCYMPAGTSWGDFEEFFDRVRTSVPNATVVPVINGTDNEARAEELVMSGRELGLAPTYTMSPLKLRGALMAGYKSVARDWSDATIVRLDTAEHPPEYIPRLAARAENISGMVIGDLTFTEDLLPPDSREREAHHVDFPNLYRRACGVPLSAAHGFQAFAPGIIHRLLRAVRPIYEILDRHESCPTWGFDAAAVLAARHLNIPVERIEIPGEVARDRSVDKIDLQLANAQNLCAAFKEAYN